MEKRTTVRLSIREIALFCSKQRFKFLLRLVRLFHIAVDSDAKRYRVFSAGDGFYVQASNQTRFRPPFLINGDRTVDQVRKVETVLFFASKHQTQLRFTPACYLRFLPSPIGVRIKRGVGKERREHVCYRGSIRDR